MAERQRLAVAAMDRERAAIAAREGQAPVAAPAREGELTAPRPDQWSLTEDGLFPRGRPLPRVAELLRLLAAPDDSMGSQVSEAEFRALLRDSRAAALDTSALMKKATPPDPPTGPRPAAPKQTPFVEIFLRPAKVTAATEFLAAHAAEMRAAEGKHGVASADITAILLWQSNLGQVTGDLHLFNHFVGQAIFLPDAFTAAVAAGHPDNAAGSHAALVEKTTRNSLQAAATLIRASKMKHLDALAIKGIAGGGVGYAQFTPNGFRWLEDGDGDGVLQFDSYADAVMSIANCLEAGGYRTDRKKGLLNYNPGEEWARGIQRVGDAIALAAPQNPGESP